MKEFFFHDFVKKYKRFNRKPVSGWLDFAGTENGNSSVKKQIINLIRSCYIKKFGAFCYIKNKKITVLEASINNSLKFEGIIPGRVVKINQNGSIWTDQYSNIWGAVKLLIF